MRLTHLDSLRWIKRSGGEGVSEGKWSRCGGVLEYVGGCGEEQA